MASINVFDPILNPGAQSLPDSITGEAGSGDRASIFAQTGPSIVEVRGTHLCNREP